MDRCYVVSFGRRCPSKRRLIAAARLQARKKRRQALRAFGMPEACVMLGKIRIEKYLKNVRLCCYAGEALLAQLFDVSARFISALASRHVGQEFLVSKRGGFLVA